MRARRLVFCAQHTQTLLRASLCSVSTTNKEHYFSRLWKFEKKKVILLTWNTSRSLSGDTPGVRSCFLSCTQVSAALFQKFREISQDFAYFCEFSHFSRKFANTANFSFFFASTLLMCYSACFTKFSAFLSYFWVQKSTFLKNDNWIMGLCDLSTFSKNFLLCVVKLCLDLPYHF